MIDYRPAFSALSCWLIVATILFSGQPLAAAQPGKGVGTSPPSLFFDYSVVDGHDELLILADSPISKHKAFRLENPPRLVLDIPGFGLLEDVVGLPINRPELSRIRIAKHPDKVRFVFDLTNEKPVRHEIVPVENGLKVILVPDNTPVISAKKSKKNSKGEAIEHTPAPAPAPDVAGQVLGPAGLQKLLGTQRVTILFHKAPVSEFFSYVSEKCGMPIMVNPAIGATLSLRLTDVTLSQAVELVQKQYNLVLTLQDNTLYVEPGKAQPPAS